MPSSNLAIAEDRREDRDEVHHRTRAIHGDGRPLALLVVNLSPRGFMARCEAAIMEGDVIRLTLPGVGALAATVRWSLGGRIGCQFDRPIDATHYPELLANLT